MAELREMSIEALEQRLAKLKEDFEELEEERLFVLGQSGYHVSGGTVRKYEAEVKKVQDEIAEVEQILREKKANA